MVRWLIASWDAVTDPSLNTLVTRLPSTARSLPVGPWMERILSIARIPWDSMIGLASPDAKVMVLPGAAAAIAARSVQVAGQAAPTASPDVLTSTDACAPTGP